jgi:prevent-host-death family protein
VKSVTTHEAKTHLSRLIREVQAGEIVIILNGAVPVARLTATEDRSRSRPSVGTVTSEAVHYTEDAFEPMSDEELETWGL